MLQKQNLEQVKKFYKAGTATELDLQRAKAQYSSTIANAGICKISVKNFRFKD